MVINAAAGIFAFLALGLIALWATNGVGRPSDARIRALAIARQKGEGLASLPFQERVVVPLIEGLGKRVAALLPGAFVRRAQQRLTLAGDPMTVPGFYTLMLGFGTGTAGVYAGLVMLATGGSPSTIALLPGLIIGVIAMYLVNFWLSAKAKRRKTLMVKGLPDSMDLLTICVEAGLGLDAAFHRVAQRQRGPLVDEIQRMLREVGLGKARRDALLDLADRTGIEDVRSFANAVIQAEQLGTSLAQVLRVQSERVRMRRRQRAEQAARRVPVKMVFPLVMCLMPSLFIFILGPIAVNLIRYLGEA